MTLSATNTITGLKKQQGIVLVVALLILVVMTVLSVSMLSSSTLEERMASNLQSQNAAFQAAESCIRNTLAPVNEGQRKTAAVNYDPKTANPNIICSFNGVSANVALTIPATSQQGVDKLSGFGVGVASGNPLIITSTSSLASGTSSTIEEVIQQVGAASGQ
ncbi:hypothetical protein MNBD_GAMMA24-2603 [hydrothermal vent metagenome]|uniref:Type 4 fimbrial biogenesis protein PilX N-terminal domain-containing protein n=1 Tax=hydrothermal vent metagenome TaxID=652676 RepID=A0A3B1BNC5_9ZZZZ